MNRAEYEEMEARRIERNLEYLDAGVVFIDLKAVYIDEGVRIGKGTVDLSVCRTGRRCGDRRKLHHRTEYQDQGFDHRKRHIDPEFRYSGKQGGQRDQCGTVRIPETEQ